MSQHLKISRDGHCTTSPGNLCHCLTVLTGKKKHNTKTLCPYILFQLMPVASYLPNLHTCAQRAALSAWWLQHKQWGLLLGPLKPFLLQAEQAQHLSLPLLMVQVLHIQLPSQCSLLRTSSVSFLYWRVAHWGARRVLVSHVGVSKMVCTYSWSGTWPRLSYVQVPTTGRLGYRADWETEHSNNFV